MTISNDFFLELAKGNIPGHSIVHKFGKNPDIDIASGFEALWNGGEEYTGFNATEAQIVEVYSTSANDTAAGSGARTAQLFGLDKNGDEQDEVIILSGLIGTSVDSAKEYLRLDRVKITSAGTTGHNEGAITVRQKTTIANIFAVMPIGNNQTAIACYTIPNKQRGLLYDWFASAAKKQTAFSNARIKARPFGGVFQVKEEMSVVTSGSSLVDRGYKLPKNTLGPMTDIYIEADTDTNGMGISGGFSLILYKVK